MNLRVSRTELRAVQGARSDQLPIPVSNRRARDSYADHDVVADSDSVVFTNKRLIAINVQGLTGKKRDYSSLPYNKIQAWSIETAGRFDLDAELEPWFSGLGKVRLDFKGQVDIRSIGQLIGKHVL